MPIFVAMMRLRIRYLFTFILLLLSLSGDAVPNPESGLKAFDNAAEEFREKFRNDSLLSFRSGKGYVPFLLGNLADQALFLTRMTEKKSLFLMGAAGVTATLNYYDRDIDKEFRTVKDKSAFVRDFSPVITEFGDYYGYAFLAGLGTYSLVTSNHRLLHTSMLASQAAITSGLWSRGVKILTGRMRPEATYEDPEYKNGHWFGPFAVYNSKYNQERGVAAFASFPSGHTTAAFSIATVFAEQYSDYKAVPWIAYSLSGIVAVTRLVEHQHWASDLVPGALIGYYCGKQVVRRYQSIFPEYARSSAVRKKSKGNLNFSLHRENMLLYYRLVF